MEKAVPRAKGIVFPRLAPELQDRDKKGGYDMGPQQMARETPGPIGLFLDPLLVAPWEQWVRFLFASRTGSVDS